MLTDATVIDTIMKDHRKYIKCLYVYNKVDSIGIPHLDELAREPHTVVMSCELDLGIQDVVERCWKELALIRIYTYVFPPPNTPPLQSTLLKPIIYVM